MEALKLFRVGTVANGGGMVRQKAHYYEIDESGYLHFYFMKDGKKSRIASFANLLWWTVSEEIEES